MVDARCTKLQQGHVLGKASFQLLPTLWVLDFLWGRSLKFVFFWIPRQERLDKYLLPIISVMKTILPPLPVVKTGGMCIKGGHPGAPMATLLWLQKWATQWLGSVGPHPPVFTRCSLLPGREHGPAEQRRTKQARSLLSDRLSSEEKCASLNTH